MERPLKRQRLSLSPGDEDNTSDVDLHEARAQNDLRLKSIFEGIFEKYGRDFTDIGDEIDLQTGKILVNNGHIHALDKEEDAEAIGDWLSDPDSPAASSQQAQLTVKEGTRTPLHAQRTDDATLEEDGERSGRKVISILSQMLRRPDEDSREIMHDEGARTTSEAEDDRSSVDSLLDTALCVRGTREVGTSKALTEKAIPRPEESDQSQIKHIKELDETVDPIWRVPKISAKFTTPTLLSRSRPKSIIKTTTVRSQSPPGAGSLWALPWTSRRNTDVMKRRKRKDGSPKKRKKHHSSPIISDWSFAQTPHGSESDDPLQEDYEPSPTPKRTLYIREKRKDPLAASRTKNTCDYCKQSFSQDGYVSHLRSVLSDPSDNKHDLTDLKRQLDKVTGGCSPGAVADATATAEHNVRSFDKPTSGPGSNEGQKTNNDSPPTGTRRARATFGPGEARQIIQMRQIQGMKWKDVLEHFPQKKVHQLVQWYSLHWTERKANPPRLSKPWSKTELGQMENLKDRLDLTWPEIRAELPGRSLVEIEFQWLRLWAGEGVDSTGES